MQPIAHLLASTLLTLALATAAWAADARSDPDAAAPAAAVAPQDARTQALRTLVGKVDLPYTRQLFELMFADLRRNAAAQFIDGIGRGGHLGDGWRAGNPQWEQAHRMVSELIDAEEAAGGPIFDIGRDDIVAHLQVPWSDAEIAFLSTMADADLGRAYVRWIDLSMLPGMVAGIRKQPAYSPELNVQAMKLMAQARRDVGPAILELERLKREHAQEMARIEALTAQLGSRDGEELGRALVSRPVDRMIGAMYGALPALHQIVEDYRRLTTNPATRL